MHINIRLGILIDSVQNTFHILARRMEPRNKIQATRLVSKPSFAMEDLASVVPHVNGMHSHLDSFCGGFINARGSRRIQRLGSGRGDAIDSEPEWTQRESTGRGPITLSHLISATHA
jgi:hypothetical protein